MHPAARGPCRSPDRVGRRGRPAPQLGAVRAAGTPTTARTCRKQSAPPASAAAARVRLIPGATRRSVHPSRLDSLLLLRPVEQSRLWLVGHKCPVEQRCQRPTMGCGVGWTHPGGIIHSRRACAPRVTSPRRPGTVLTGRHGGLLRDTATGQTTTLGLRRIARRANNNAEAPSSDSRVG